jgi:hypothetical protein
MCAGPVPIVVAQEASLIPQVTAPIRAAEDERLSHWARLHDAIRALPIATGLGAALALRPRRFNIVRRPSAVIETQIILAIIGAVVMLVVGSSLARAFGVVGAAGLVRYRAKIDDPKDAGVMLSTLAVGLAAGIGLYMLATFAAVFIIGVLWIIEWFEPEARKVFTLKLETKDPAALQPRMEQLLRRQRARFELRAATPEEVSFQVSLPARRSTDPISKAILGLEGVTAVDWSEEKKPKGSA